MAHYNIYDDLNLDRSLGSATIAKILDDRLATTPASDVADQDRLKTALQLFRDESRREAYDKALDDPSSPEITIGRFRAFADGINPNGTKHQATEAPQAGASASAPSGSHAAGSLQTGAAAGEPAHTEPSHNSSAPSPAQPQAQSQAQPQSDQGQIPWSAAPAQQTTAQHAAFPAAPAQGAAPQGLATQPGQKPHNQGGFDLSSLAVHPDRKRTESLMWLIGWVLILLPWLFLLAMLLFGQDSSGGLLDGFYQASGIAIVTLAVLFHTGGMLVTLNTIWHIRVFFGRKLS